MITFEITNLSEFQKSAGKINSRIRNNVEAALEDAAKDIAQGAKNRVPVDTGELKDSISLKPDEEELGFFIGTGAPHARFIEFGTLKKPARPFLIPAFEEETPRLKPKIGEALTKALRGQT